LVPSFVRPEADQVIVAWNPKSGRQSRESLIRDVAERMRAAGLRVTSASDLESIKSHVEKARGQGSLRAVVAAGGDGTVRLIAQHLGPNTPLAILPLGTENLLARYLRLNADPRRLIDMILADTRRTMDAAMANETLFLIVFSCGFDAEVVSRTHERRRGHIRRSDYVPWVLHSMANYPYPPLKISVDGLQLADLPRWAFVFNVPRYAMDLGIVPEASPDDGLLDLQTFAKGGSLRGLGYFFGVLFRRHRRMKESSHQRGRSIRIESTQQVAFQIDGDPGGFLPVDIRVLPNYLNVFVPSGNS
jgi:diacylglycerol kinase family enzyme